MKYAGSRFGTHDCPNSENRAKCLANKLFEETPECGGVKIEGDLIYFENAFGRDGDCAPIIADDFRLRVKLPEPLPWRSVYFQLVINAFKVVLKGG